MYACCAFDKTIKFFSPLFDYLNSFSVNFPISFMRYNGDRDELIVASGKDVAVIALEANIYRGRMRIQCQVRAEIQPQLPPNQWISELHFDELTRRVFVMADTWLLVRHR